MTTVYDAIIIGGGPAGASCAQWLALMGLSPVLVDARERPGGLQNDCPYPNPWIVAMPGVTGLDVACGIARGLEEAGVPMFTATRATGARRTPDGFEVDVAGFGGQRVERLAGRFLVLATGVRRRDGGLGGRPGILVGPGGNISGHDYRGLRVAVLGGGDNGFENCGMVRGMGAREVHLYARAVRARRQFVARMPAADLHVGPYRVDADALKVNGRPYDLILLFYGWEAEATLAAGLGAELDGAGFVRADGSARTTVPGLFAIGEITQRMHPAVATAMADGIIAAKAIQEAVENGAAPALGD